MFNIFNLLPHNGVADRMWDYEQWGRWFDSHRLPPEKEEKGIFSRLRTCKTQPLKNNDKSNIQDHCKSLQYQKRRIGYWVSHRGSWHNLGNLSGLVGCSGTPSEDAWLVGVGKRAPHGFRCPCLVSPHGSLDRLKAYTFFPLHWTIKYRQNRPLAHGSAGQSKVEQVEQVEQVVRARGWGEAHRVRVTPALLLC